MTPGSKRICFILATALIACLGLASPMPVVQGDALPAAELRIQLDYLFGEQVLLTASVTEARLRKRTNEFDAALAALEKNAEETATLIGSIYGADVQTTFLSLWRKQTDLLLQYVDGGVGGDPRKQKDALISLEQYGWDMGLLLQTANPALSSATIAGFEHRQVVAMQTVIDAQAALTAQHSGDQQAAYPALRVAYAGVDAYATSLATGIARQFPAQFPGNIESDIADFRAALTLLLSEHAYLVAKSGAAALAARTIEFEAAAGALDQNSLQLAALIGSVYGPDAEATFLSGWRRRVGILIDYTLALILQNEKERQKALVALDEDATSFATFLQTLSPVVSVKGVADLLNKQRQLTVAAIDAAATDQQAQFYTALRATFYTTPSLASALTNSAVAQFPEYFGVQLVERPRAPVAQSALINGRKPALRTDLIAVSIPVVIDRSTFQPQRIEVPTGATIVWINQDATNHTVTAGAPGAQTGLFDSGFFAHDKQFSYRFTRPGEFAYFSRGHSGTRGVIVVQ